MQLLASVRFEPMKSVRGRPRNEEVTERVAHILDVAEALFVQDGYQAVSVDAIAAAARISKKTIYSQFENKAGLLAAVVDRLARSKSVEMARDDHASLYEGLMHRAKVILDASYDRTTVRFDIILFREGRHFPELGETFERAARERYIQPVEDFLAVCAKRGQLRDVDPAFAARAFVHLLTAEIIIQTAMGEEATMSPAMRYAHAKRVCGILVRGIAA